MFFFNLFIMLSNSLILSNFVLFVQFCEFWHILSLLSNLVILTNFVRTIQFCQFCPFCPNPPLCPKCSILLSFLSNSNQLVRFYPICPILSIRRFCSFFKSLAFYRLKLSIFFQIEHFFRILTRMWGGANSKSWFRDDLRARFARLLQWFRGLGLGCFEVNFDDRGGLI